MVTNNLETLRNRAWDIVWPKGKLESCDLSKVRAKENFLLVDVGPAIDKNKKLFVDLNSGGIFDLYPDFKDREVDEGELQKKLEEIKRRKTVEG